MFNLTKSQHFIEGLGLSNYINKLVNLQYADDTLSVSCRLKLPLYLFEDVYGLGIVLTLINFLYCALS